MLDRGEIQLPNVLHLISSLRVGGAERLLVSSMQAAKAAGISSFAVAIMNDEIDEKLAADLQDAGAPVYRLGRRQGHLHPRYLTAILTICRMHNIRVIHAHNAGSRFWAMLAKACRPGLKVVYTVHSQGDAPAIQGINRLAYRGLIDATVAISACVSAECRDLAGAGLVQIENGIDLARFASARRIDQPGMPLRIVHVGRFAPVKGQDILVEGIRRCIDKGLAVHCTLAGTIADARFYSQLKMQIAALDLGDHVTIELDRLDIETVLAAGDIFVLPSREEGFGLAVVEAMAAGLPVIVSKVGGAAEIVRHDENGLHFPVGDCDALAHQIARLAADHNLRHLFRDAGIRTAGRYDIAETLASHCRLYRALTKA